MLDRACYSLHPSKPTTYKEQLLTHIKKSNEHKITDTHPIPKEN